FATRDTQSEELDNKIKEAAEKLLDFGVETVVITLGAEGSFLATKEEQTRIESFKVEAVDTTAAGDTYCGCLATALTEGKSLEKSVVFASAGAALSVTKMGAQPSAPIRKEIDEFLNSRS
ncbi:MAG: PfkB family carbohydrate kinase, partial [Bacteroidales bacterium]